MACSAWPGAYDHLEDGCEEFDLALQLDPDNFRAQMWLAETYARQGKVDLAIETSLTALKQCPDDELSIQADILSSIRIWKYALGDEAGAIEAIKTSFAAEKDSASFGQTGFQMLHQLGQHQLIIDMAKNMDEIPSERVSGTLLDDFVRTSCPHIIIGYAANAVGQLDYVDRLFKRVISNASHENDILHDRRQRTHYGWFVFTLKRDESEALKICKGVVSEYLASPPPRRFFHWNDRESRQFAESLLIRMYLRKALAGQSDASTTWFTELRNLSQRLEALKSQEVEASIYKNDGSSAIGLWYRLHCQRDVAKTWLRGLVLEGLQILTDADPDNDIEGYLILGKALLTFGDSRNANIVFAVAEAPPDYVGKMQEQDREQTATPVNAAEITPTQPPNESSDAMRNEGAAKSNPEVSDAVEKEYQAAYSPFQCDGQCGRRPKTWTAYYKCEYCYKTGFCDECAALVKASKIPFRICDSSHPFLQIYPLDMDMARAGAFVEEGVIIPRAEWLNELRQEWTA
jgi:tetratricopeptide (TPR) repeat protein